MDAGVKDYYETNTRGFLRFGQGASTGTIHRAVWGPQVRDRTEAFAYAHGRLTQLLPEQGRPRVADLGCGVGATLVDLARARSIDGIGFTLSPTQASLGAARVAAAGLSDSLHIVEGDYTRLPDGLDPVDLAYGIESFVHGPDPDAFFAEASRIVKPGGRLALCDDFLTARGSSGGISRRERRCLAEFRRGWHIGTLLTPEQAKAKAAAHGFEPLTDEDWTPWLELQRPRDRVIAAAVKLGRRLPIAHPWWNNLIGGNALQFGLLGGLLSYRLIVWRRD